MKFDAGEQKAVESSSTGKCKYLSSRSTFGSQFSGVKFDTGEQEVLPVSVSSSSRLIAVQGKAGEQAGMSAYPQSSATQLKVQFSKRNCVWQVSFEAERQADTGEGALSAALDGEFTLSSGGQCTRVILT